MTAADLQAREDVRDVLHAYAFAIDGRDWAALGRLFAADAVADFGSVGGVHEGRSAIVAHCRGALEHLDATQHLVGNATVRVAAPAAQAECYFQAQHVRRGAPGGDLMLIAGRYTDVLAREEDRWVLAHRTLTPMWHAGNPAVLKR